MRYFARSAVLVLLGVALTGCDGTGADEHLDRARAHLAEQKVSAAVIEIRNAIRKAPQLAEARRLLADAYRQQGDYAAALREYERALDLGQDDTAVRLGLLQSKLGLGRFNEVIGDLEGRGDLEPELAVLLGEAYLQADDLLRADIEFNRARSLAAGKLGLATVAWRRGDPDQAAALFRESLDQDPGNAQAWLRKGEFELARGATAAAAAAFSAAAGLPPTRVPGRLGLARVRIVEGDLDAAAVAVQEALRMAPDAAMAQYLDGLIRFEQGDLDGAAAALRQVLQAAPEHPPSRFLMGVIDYRQGRLEAAEDHLRRFLDTEPDSAAAARLLASVAFDRGAPEAAAQVLQPFVQTSSDPQILAMYGSAQLRLGNAGAATQALERAVALAPDMTPFRQQLALSLLAAGESARARAELERAIGAGGDQFQSEYLLAMLSARDGDWQAATEAVESLVEKHPDNPVGYHLRGTLALAGNDRETAAAAFQAALQKDPAYLPAVQNLASLAERGGDVGRARGHYQAFLERNPGHEGALLACADLELRNDDPQAAIELVERSVQANPESQRSRLGLARLLLAGNRLVEASEAVDEALQADPRSVDLLLLRADIDLRRGDAEAARGVASILQQRVAEAPRDAGLRLRVGRLLASTGEFAAARENLEQALALGESPDPTALHTLVGLDLREGKLPAARARVEQLLEVDAGAASRLLEAELLLAEDDERQARRVLDALAAAGSREAVMRLATLDLRAGRADGSVARLERWLEEEPDDAGAQLLLADALIVQDSDRAIARYEALAHTGNPVVLNNLAWLYMERDDPRAVATARRAAAVAPQNAKVLDTLGWVLLQQGESAAEALRALRRSAELEPDNPSVQYHLGIALRDSGDVAGARAALQRALSQAAFPELEEARAALSQLAES